MDLLGEYDKLIKKEPPTSLLQIVYAGGAVRDIKALEYSATFDAYPDRYMQSTKIHLTTIEPVANLQHVEEIRCQGNGIKVHATMEANNLDKTYTYTFLAC